ncbi:MAG: Mo-dependent nitrogenase C-terminal domain-containing protein [Synechococcales bacterium]|nr:Mo-dependent nitrogenase C-terminal domain-containing protein [Synechococcales bacterium]
MSNLELASHLQPPARSPIDALLNVVLKPVRNWLDDIEINDRQTAHLICRLIPDQCPFARDIMLMGRKLGYIPPLCKLNPLYDQLVGLRFRSLCYLVDVCGETI